METTKRKAAELLGVSKAEIVRMIESGELKARKKTDSKFSDWVIELPDEKKAKELTKKIEIEFTKRAGEDVTLEEEVKVKEEIKPDEKVEEEVEPDEEEKPEEEKKSEEIEDEKTKARKRRESFIREKSKEQKSGKGSWWF